MDHEGTLNVTSTPTPPVPLVKLFPRDLSQLLPTDKLPSWRIFVSSQRVTPNQYTTHKTTNRAVYDNVRAALPNPMEGSIPSEVLLVNIHHQVMEGSITTPYFLRGKRWVTPPAAHGGNVGTTRRWALENGLCVEEEVPVDSLVPGECIWLSNGVRGWGWGYLEPQSLPDSSSSNVAGRSEG
jgi:branched-subunit amino acid aminotransferase/4-amino-4-deoxychorismate lyase